MILNLFAKGWYHRASLGPEVWWFKLVTVWNWNGLNQQNNQSPGMKNTLLYQPFLTFIVLFIAILEAQWTRTRKTHTLITENISFKSLHWFQQPCPVRTGWMLLILLHQQCWSHNTPDIRLVLSLDKVRNNKTVTLNYFLWGFFTHTALIFSKSCSRGESIQW